MKNFFVALLLFVGTFSFAQNSSVIATVTDGDGQTWNNGTYQIYFVPPSGYTGTAYTFNGSSWTPPAPVNGVMNGAGTFSYSPLPRNDYILPSGSGWAFKVCPLASGPCSTTTLIINQPTQNISSSLVIVAPRFAASNVILGSFGYNDTEILPTIPPIGNFYWNVSLRQVRYWDGTEWISNFSLSALQINALLQTLTNCNVSGEVYSPQASGCIPQTGGMVYPSTGIVLSTGSAWAASLAYAFQTGYLWNNNGSLSFVNPYVNSVTPTTDYAADFNSQWIRMNCSSPCTVTIPSVISMGYIVAISNVGTSTVTIASGGPSYDGITSLPQGIQTRVFTDGTAYHSSSEITTYGPGLSFTYNPAGSTLVSAFGSLTTNGSSGPATLSGSVLNIPQYSGGCSVSGIGQDYVLSVYPTGSCYGSVDFTWDDTSNKQNLLIGNGTSTTTSSQQTFAIGANDIVAPLPGAISIKQVEILGDNNAAGLNSEGYIVGNSNQIGGSTNSNSSSELFLYGDGNAITGDDLNNIHIIGDSNAATQTTNSMTDVFMLGVINSVEDSLADTDDVEIVGEQNDVNGAQSTATVIGYFNELENVTQTGAEDANIVVTGSNNLAVNTSNSAVRSAYTTIVGQLNYVHDCSACSVVGTGIEESTDHQMGIGMSHTPELQFTAGNLQRTPQAFASGGLATAVTSSTVSIGGIGGTCLVAFTGGTGSGGTGFINVTQTGQIFLGDQILITSEGTYTVAPTAATLTNGTNTNCTGHSISSVFAQIAILSACSSSTNGSIASITDSTTNVYGAVISGGGTNEVMGYCNGTNWTVMGGGGGGSGVTSVALVGSANIFSSTSGTPVTTSGTLNLDSQLLAQAANCVLAGPTTGSSAAPTCRLLVNADFSNSLAPTISAANMTNFPASATTLPADAGIANTDTMQWLPSFSPSNPIPTSYLTLPAQPGQQYIAPQCISGCGVEYMSGLTYTVGASTYQINGVTYSAAGLQNVTLPAADPTNDEIDVIFIDATGVAQYIQGTPAVSPVEPTVDPSTQLALTFAYIPATATTPSNTGIDAIYLNGGEWIDAKGGTNSARVTLLSTNNPYPGATHDVEFGVGGTVTTTTYAQMTVPAAGTVNLSSWNNLIFYIRNKAAWPANRSITVQWFNGATAEGTPLVISNGAFGFNATTNTSTYQQILIPTATFQTGSGLMTTVRFTVTGSGAALTGFYLGQITLQSGVGGSTLPATLMNWKGSWNSTASYNPNDTVVSSGIGYVALVANTNVAVTTASTWATLASSGLSGMTTGQVAIAGSSTTITGSEALAGAGAGVTTGPVSGTVANDLITMNGTNGQIKDSGTPISSLATLASPTLTGTPAAPTATGGTNTTQLATTAFVQAAIAALPPIIASSDPRGFNTPAALESAVNYNNGACVFGSNVASGNELIVGAYAFSGSMPTGISDTRSTSFTSTQTVSGFQINYRGPLASSGADTVTVASTDSRQVTGCSEFSGLSNSLDGLPQTGNSASITTADPNDLLVATLFDYGATENVATPGAGWTLLYSNPGSTNNSGSVFAYYKVASSAGTYTATWSGAAGSPVYTLIAYVPSGSPAAGTQGQIYFQSGGSTYPEFVYDAGAWRPVP